MCESRRANTSVGQGGGRGGGGWGPKESQLIYGFVLSEGESASPAHAFRVPYGMRLRGNRFSVVSVCIIQFHSAGPRDPGMAALCAAGLALVALVCTTLRHTARPPDRAV